MAGRTGVFVVPITRLAGADDGIGASPALHRIERSTTVCFAPSQPNGVKGDYWIRTDPSMGWNTLLWLYSPRESFFAKACGRVRSNA